MQEKTLSSFSMQAYRDVSLPFGIAVFFLLFTTTLKSQNTIFIRTFTAPDSIMLRWAPANAEVWKVGNTNGYVIERFTTDEYFDLNGQDPAGKGKLLTPSPLFPLTKSDTNWNHLVNTGENAIIYQSLYGTKSTDPKKRVLEENLQFGLALKACDNSVSSARIHGLYFSDSTIVKGKSYVYLIRVNNSNRYSAVISVDGKLSTIHSPGDLSGKFKSKSVMLSFSITSSREDAAGYIIERSDDSIHFIRVNPQLLVFTKSQYETTKSELSYRDSIPVNGKTYWYRVKTFSCFGIESAPSNAIAGKGKEEWPVYPIIDTLYSSDNKTAEIKWKLSETQPANLHSLVLLRAAKAEGPYTIINTAVDPNYQLIKDDHPLASNYYMLCAINNENDSGFSYPYFLGLKDETPPAIPSGLTGIIDTNGIVKLKWNTVNDADLKGYRVFRCNAEGEEPVEITDSLLVKPEFCDSITLQTLTKNIYYAVRSVDVMYNNSTNSPLVRLRRPDRIAPVGIVPLNIFHTDSTIILQWRNSSSDDVMKKELLRSDGKITVTLFSTQNDSVSHFIDVSAVPENSYTYSILLTDSSGNRTKTDFPALQYSPRIVPSLKHFTAKVDTMDRKIKLAWDAPSTTVYHYVIYRAKKGEQLREWKTVNGTITSIDDSTVYVGNTYQYRIKAIMTSGSETRMASLEIDY